MDDANASDPPAYRAPRWERYVESGGRRRRLISPERLSSSRNGMSQAGLAEAAGCSKSFVGHLEAGTREGASAVLAAKIEEVLGVEPGYIFEPAPGPSNGDEVSRQGD